MQLGRVNVPGLDPSGWLYLADACSTAMLHPGSEVFTGYFDPKSDIVKQAYAMSRKLNDA